MSADTEHAGWPFQWSVSVRGLQAQARVGVYAPERQAAQAIVLDAELHCAAATFPQRLSQVLDYDAFCALVADHLGREQHTDLLETLAAELLCRAYSSFPQLAQARLSLCKPAAAGKAASVRVQLALSRRQCALLQQHQPHAAPTRQAELATDR